ncbi:MAG: hypothetical protein LQ350_008603 [Teloschistes chrysophthalmus]|nr:MAG: hypothetical protein LQ350_008603 [Niorma chrysophthalma]
MGVGSHRAPTFADLTGLPHTRAVIKEILQLCPGNPFTIKRFTTAPVHYKTTPLSPPPPLSSPTPTPSTRTLSAIPTLIPSTPPITSTTLFPSADYVSQSDPSAPDHYTFGVGRRI